MGRKRQGENESDTFKYDNPVSEVFDGIQYEAVVSLTSWDPIVAITTVNAAAI